MRNWNGIAVAICTATLLSTPAQAQERPQRKTGLWEYQVTTIGASLARDMQAELARMPPEKRAQTEQSMKSAGFDYGAGALTQTVRYCLGAEEAAAEAKKPLLATVEKTLRNSGTCEESLSDRTASSVRFHATCRGPAGTAEYDGRMYDLTPMSSALEMKGRSPEHGDVEIRQKARWIGADCGGTK